MTGTYNAETLNLEGSGVVRRIGPNVNNFKIGDRVAGVAGGQFKNIEVYDARLLQKIDDEHSFDSMATLFLPFVTAVYSLVHLAKLQKGETVLIHSATGGVGLAAIQIAQHIGAEIIATVGAPEKRQFLKENYGLDDAHILNSRDTSFAKGVMELTKGRGVDVSLNSLVREQLKATWNCIAMQGRHVEVGQTDMLDEGYLDMTPFLRSASFIAVDLNLIMNEKPELITEYVNQITLLTLITPYFNCVRY